MRQKGKAVTVIPTEDTAFCRACSYHREASIGTPSIPRVRIVVLSTALYEIRVRPSGIAFIVGVDCVTDMSRATVNIAGDLTACAIMNRYSEQTSK